MYVEYYKVSETTFRNKVVDLESPVTPMATPPKWAPKCRQQQSRLRPRLSERDVVDITDHRAITATLGDGHVRQKSHLSRQHFAQRHQQPFIPASDHQPNDVVCGSRLRPA